MRRFPLVLAAALWATSLSGQAPPGTYTTVNEQGQTVTLVLEQAPQGSLRGTLSAPGLAFRVEGISEGAEAMGTIQGAEGGAYFHATLEASRIVFVVIEPGPDGQPDLSRASQLVFSRAAAAETPVQPAPEPAPAPAAPPAPPTAAPGAAAGAPVPEGLVGDRTLGYFFRTPSGWGANQREALFLLGSDTHHGMILVLPHELSSLEALRGEAAEGLHEEGVSLRLSGSVEPFGDRGLAAEYSGVAGGQPARARAVGLLSPHGGGVTIVALVSEQAYGPDYVRWVEEIAHSVEFRAPETGPVARGWEDEVRGRRLRFMESYYSGGAVAGGYSIQRDLYLCSSGEYLYRDSSLVSADAGGVSGLGHGQGGETGRWEVSARGQDGILRLTSQDGQVRSYTLSWRNNLIHLNGERYFRDTNDVCP